MEKELELLEKISSKQELTAKEVGEVKAAATEVKKQAEDLTTKVAELTADIATKGATLLQIQEEQKELKAKSGRMKGQAQAPTSLKQMIADTLLEHKDAIMKSEKGPLVTNMEVKVVGPILSANLTGTGNNYISYLDWRPGMEPTGQFHFRDLVRTINSETDFVRFPRANTPLGEGSFGRVAEGNTKPQVDRDYTMIDLTLTALAAFTIVSRQSLRNITFLQSWLPTSLMDQMFDTEDVDFANTLVGAATGSTSISGYNAGGFTGTPEKIIAYIANLIKSKYKPTAVVVDPNVWASLLVYQPGRTTTPSTTVAYSNPFVVTVGTDGTVRVLGIPIIPVNWLSGGRFIAGDWTKAAIVQSEGITMRQSDSHASIFTANELAFLLEEVNGLAIFRPDAFITGVL